jgi:hypothetical protein
MSTGNMFEIQEIFSDVVVGRESFIRRMEYCPSIAQTGTFCCIPSGLVYGDGNLVSE